ncbi:MAG: hypothetical protein WB770_08505, partial [Acidimicrobiales bacterium]
MRHALQLGLDSGSSSTALRAYNNLMTFLEYDDRVDEALDLGIAALELARRTGDRTWETGVVATLLVPLFLAGRWEELLERADELEQLGAHVVFGEELDVVAVVHALQGDFERADALLDVVSGSAPPDVQARSMRFGCIAAVRRAEGDARRAFEAAEAAIDAGKMLPFAFIGIKLGLIGAIESAFDLGDEAKAEQMLVRIESLLPGESTPFLDAVAARFRARLSANRGIAGTDASFKGAEAKFRRLSTPFWLAMTLLEHAEWLVAEKGSKEAGSLL